MKKWMRVLVRLLTAVIVPPILGLLITVALYGFTEGFSGLTAQMADDLGFLLKAAFLFTLIPSLCMFALLECLLSRKLKSIVGYMVFGAVLGFFSGWFILFVINHQVWLLHPVSFLGSVVGLVVGSIFYFLYKPQSLATG